MTKGEPAVRKPDPPTSQDVVGRPEAFSREMCGNSNFFPQRQQPEARKIRKPSKSSNCTKRVIQSPEIGVGEKNRRPVVLDGSPVPDYKDQVRSVQHRHALVPGAVEESAQQPMGTESPAKSSPAPQGGPTFKDQARSYRFVDIEEAPETNHLNEDSRETQDGGRPRLNHLAKNANSSLTPQHRRQDQWHDSESVTQQQSSSSSPWIPNAFLVDSTIIQGDPVIVESESSSKRIAARCRRKVVCVVLVAIVVGSAIVAGGFCGTGACSREESSNDFESTNVPSPSPSTELTIPPTSDSVEQARRRAISSYINNITLSGKELDYPVIPVSNVSTEEKALQWLIEDDPLHLTADTAYNKFRLRQRYALSTLWFQSTEPWTMSSNWLDGDECTWFGLLCIDDMVGDAVLQKDMVSRLLRYTTYYMGNNIHGQFSSDLGLLSHLTQIIVGANYVSGTLPESFGRLTLLKEFQAYRNAISGTLPDSLGQWSHLRVFHADGNLFTGALPESIGNWSYLTFFNVHTNSLSGTIPMSIVNWKDLEQAWFHGNSITGTMPLCSASMSSITNLWADCGDEVECPCCHVCCPDLDLC